MNKEEILREQWFPSEGIEVEERDKILNLISLCKDINDTELGLSKIGTLIELRMKRIKNDIISLSGSISYGTENRCIDGYVYYEKDSIIFDTHMTRLCVNDVVKEYRMLDIFEPIKDGFRLTSTYNYNNKKFVNNISMKENKTIWEKLKI